MHIFITRLAQGRSRTSSLFALRSSLSDGRETRRAGFTLIELLAVVGVIAVLSVLAVGGYAGIMRAMSENTAADGIRRAVMLARQQACVDGSDIWIWPTGENKFVVIRKLGTVVQKDTGAKKPSYLNERVSSTWLVDPYAETEDASASISLDKDAAGYDQVAAKFITSFSSQYVFDLEKQVLAQFQYPPWYDSKLQSWIFGVQGVADSDGKRPKLDAAAFEEGHDYGVVVQPEQFLAKGYYFEGSVDGDGEFKPAWAKQNAIHIKSDGTVKKAVTYELSDGSESEDRKMTKVMVATDGSVRID